MVHLSLRVARLPRCILQYLAQFMQPYETLVIRASTPHARVMHALHCAVQNNACALFEYADRNRVHYSIKYMTHQAVLYGSAWVLRYLITNHSKTQMALGGFLYSKKVSMELLVLIRNVGNPHTRWEQLAVDARYVDTGGFFCSVWVDECELARRSTIA